MEKLNSVRKILEGMVSKIYSATLIPGKAVMLEPFLIETETAIKKELEACVPDMKQHSKNDPVCDISRDIGFNSCRTQTLMRIKEI